jgi:hypothetical protein
MEQSKKHSSTSTTYESYRQTKEAKRFGYSLFHFAQLCHESFQMLFSQVGHHNDSNAIKTWNVGNKPASLSQGCGCFLRVGSAESRDVQRRLSNKFQAKSFDAFCQELRQCHAPSYSFLEAITTKRFENCPCGCNGGCTSCPNERVLRRFSQVGGVRPDAL